MTAPTLLVTSAANGAGTTTVCLGLARALERRGLKVGTFKAGADARDAVLHGWAMRQPCLNLDSWAMRLDTLAGLIQDSSDGMDIVLGDGHAGLFDDDGDGGGSDADLAALLGIGIILVVDAEGAGRSLAPMVEGLLRCRSDIEIKGLFLNSVRSASHAARLIDAFDDRFSTPVVGYLIKDPSLEFEERHYHSARALESEEGEDVLSDIEQAVVDVADLDRLMRLASAPSLNVMGPLARPLPMLGQRIAVAQDEAFALGLEATLTGWQRLGAQLFPFSPLDNEPPSPFSDAVYLPPGALGQYPAMLASAREFMKGMAEAASRRAVIYGEGLGYGVLGEFMVDADGERHAMAALLPITTQVQMPTQLAGYRRARLTARHSFGPAGSELRGLDPDELVELDMRADPLFTVTSADEAELGTTGCQFETTSGSPIRLLDRRPHLAVVRR